MRKSNHVRWGVWCASVLIFAIGMTACGDDDEIIDVVDSPPTIDLTAPDGGTAVAPGGTVDITWTASDPEGAVSVDLFYTAQSEAGDVAITTEQTGTSYTWTVPNDNLFGVKVKAVARDSAGQTASDESTDIFAIVASSARNYVTSDVCRTCHATRHADLDKSGHPYKLNKVVNDAAPLYPFSSVPNPPDGFSWSDITYVIGGYGWKARFLNDSGWIMTGGDGVGIDGVNTQYNLPRSDLGGGLPATWSDYHATDTERKPYDCGPCHTTGWQDTTQNGGVHQDGLVGIAGTWEETGITCEQCHGAGLNHVVTQSAANITVDPSADLCGACHSRNGDAAIEVSGGYIRHHEQWEEMLASPHTALTCVDCHEPHIGVLYGHAAQGGIATTCEDCHTGQVLNHTAVDCEYCHMPRATKSARAVHTFEGDVRSHIFRIQTQAWPKDSMFVDSLGSTVGRDFVTLDFACYGCHKDASGEGGTGSQKTLAQLAAKAAVIHQ